MRPIAVVTGASGGVGRATSAAFARAGCDVALLARGDAGLDAAAEQVGAVGGRALAVPTDVSDYDQVFDAAARIESELGPIEVWVNDAMTTVFAPVNRIDPADFRRAVEVTFLGQVWGTIAALDRMRPRDRGAIVNVGSALAYIGIPLQSAYCASKFACRGFFESTRAELLHEGSNIRLSMVHLPAVNTPQFDWCEDEMSHTPMPVPPIYQPELAAQRILETAMDGRRERVVGSWNKLLVAAASVAPGIGNHYAAETAWESQLTDEPVPPDRETNLDHPVDADLDHGAHGGFDARANGVTDPEFLASLPSVVRALGQATTATFRERAAARRRAARSRSGELLGMSEAGPG